MDKKDFYTEIKRWPWSRKSRQLTITQDFIKYTNSSILGDSSSTFLKEEIAGLRFGIKWVRGLVFYIGIEYRVFVRNKHNEEIAICFRTYYRFRKKKLWQQYADIINALWKHFFGEIAGLYVQKFKEGKDFELCGVHFSKDGITIKAPGNFAFKEQEKFIPWEKVGTKRYATYFAIYATYEADNINRGYYYLTDWDSCILQSVTEFILKQREQIVKK